MSYNIKTTSGSKSVEVKDGTINRSFSIPLIGKNYAGYGEVQNENFLHLLEHFASSSSPTLPTTGQLWYDTTTKKIRVYNGSEWKQSGGVEVGADSLSTHSAGDIWWDGAVLWICDENGDSRQIGPFGTPSTSMTPETVWDTLGETHEVLVARVENDTVCVIANSEFTIDLDKTQLTSFTNIKRGITLTNADENGVTPASHNFWGTASDSLRLAGRIASDYVTKDGGFFSELVKFSDIGYTLGNEDDLIVKIDSDGSTPLVMATNDIIKFQTSNGNHTPLQLSGNTVQVNALVATSLHGDGAEVTGIDANNISRGFVSSDRLEGTYNIDITGTALTAESATTAVTADTARNSNLLQVGDGYKEASVEVSSGTIVARTLVDEVINGTTVTPGSIKGRFFVGTALQSLYADLAEKYLADAEYEVGTVVTIGGLFEVTACDIGDRALGVVSGKPALMMNSELDGGTYIALKGRVPVKVTGPVRKGDRLIACSNGTAQSTLVPSSDVFAIALEHNADYGVKVIEAVVI